MGRASQNTVFHVILQWQDSHKTLFHSGKNVTTPFYSVAKLSQFSVMSVGNLWGLLQKIKVLVRRLSQHVVLWQCWLLCHVNRSDNHIQLEVWHLAWFWLEWVWGRVVWDIKTLAVIVAVIILFWDMTGQRKFDQFGQKASTYSRVQCLWNYKVFQCWLLCSDASVRYGTEKAGQQRRWRQQASGQVKEDWWGSSTP